jgi:hypothetical protein
MSHLLHRSAKWTKNKKRKSGAEGEVLLLLQYDLLQLRTAAAQHCAVCCIV